ncbi:uncharacterized protein LOC130923669 [Corythoichthys intestinalis]|uniref:uncharacterized protein LOC130923669 n=1 Tax=Corythoichthys intestinalis TaxID=161448 RepID=UPI0025A54A6C|nr:uncharacterized protein LOC130923669 [Corythoichthys intestinalis]
MFKPKKCVPYKHLIRNEQAQTEWNFIPIHRSGIFLFPNRLEVKLYHVNREAEWCLVAFFLHMLRTDVVTSLGDVSNVTCNMASKHSAPNWSPAESLYLIQTLKEFNIIARLDGRKTRNRELFKKVHEKLQEAGIDRSVDQKRNRWKTLKTGYHKAKEKNNRSGYDPTNFPYFETMDEVMGGRPLANIDVHGVDVGFEEELCDGDSSSLNAAPDAETNVCISALQLPVMFNNEHNSMEGAEENTEASEDSTSQTSDSTVPRAVKKKTQSKPTSSYERALLTWSAHQQAFMERMQASQNQ